MGEKFVGEIFWGPNLFTKIFWHKKKNHKNFAIENFLIYCLSWRSILVLFSILANLHVLASSPFLSVLWFSQHLGSNASSMNRGIWIRRSNDTFDLWLQDSTFFLVFTNESRCTKPLSWEREREREGEREGERERERERKNNKEKATIKIKTKTPRS